MADNPSSDDLNVEELYLQASKEMPSTKTDEAILSFAQSQIKSQKKPVKRPGFNWRTLQWPASIAASVLLVAVLFSHYDMYRNPALIQEQHPQNQINSYDDYLDTVDASVFELEKENLSVQRKQRQVLSKEVTPSKTLESITVENTNHMEEELPEGLISAKHSLQATNDISLPQSLQEGFSSEFAKTASIDTPEVNIVAPAEAEQVVVSDSASASGSGSAVNEELDTELLESLLQIISGKSEIEQVEKRASIHKRGDSISSANSETEDNSSELSQQEAERLLKKYLNAWHKEYPNKKIPEKYRKYLENETTELPQN